MAFRRICCIRSKCTCSGIQISSQRSRRKYTIVPRQEGNMRSCLIALVSDTLDPYPCIIVISTTNQQHFHIRVDQRGVGKQDFESQYYGICGDTASNGSSIILPNLRSSPSTPRFSISANHLDRPLLPCRKITLTRQAPDSPSNIHQ